LALSRRPWPPPEDCGKPRIHVAPQPMSVDEATLFISASILLSHGVRRCAAALVVTAGKAILAPSWSIRHFRPDADSRIGWARAVLNGKKLGALVLEPGEALELVKPGACIAAGRGGPGEAEAINAAVTAILGGTPLAYTPECTGPPLTPPPWLAPAIVNIAADRAEAGLPPTPGRGPPRGKRGGRG